MMYDGNFNVERLAERQNGNLQNMAGKYGLWGILIILH